MMLLKDILAGVGGVNRKQSVAWLVFTGSLSALPNKIKESE